MNPPVLRAPNGVVQDGLDYFGAGKPYYDPAKITAPTLLVLGEWDRDTPPYMAQTLFPLLTNSPGKRFVMLAEGTHTIVMEKNRMKLFEAVQASSMRRGDRSAAPHPCKSRIAGSDRMSGAVAGGRPSHPRTMKSGPQRGTPSVVPSNPNSRLGRSRSPVAQGWEQMDAIVVGIDVSKDRLDVHVRPAGRVLSYSRDAAGIEALIGELGGVAPQLIAVEATGGFEEVVVASLAAAGLPVVMVNPAQVRRSPTRSGSAPRPTRSTRL